MAIDKAIRKARQNNQYSIEIVGYHIDNDKKELITLDNRGPQVDRSSTVHR